MKKTIVYSDLLYFSEDCDEERLQIALFRDHEDQFIQLFNLNIQTPAPMHRRSALLEVGGFDERLIKTQEYNLHLRLSAAGYRFKRVPGVVAHVREHNSPDRISNRGRDPDSDKNADLRSQIYSDLIFKFYGPVIPKNVRRFLFFRGFGKALIQIKNADFKMALKSIRNSLKFKPSLRDIMSSSVKAFQAVFKKEF